MRTYTVYAQEHAPESLLAKYPNPAEYAEGRLYLFAETLEQVSGTPALDIVDVASMGLQEDDVTEEGVLTKSALTAMVQGMLAEEMTGREVQLSIPQGKYLYSTIFAPVSNEI